jgi:hypothetical protein
VRRKETSSDISARFSEKSEKPDLLKKIVSDDETRVFHYASGTKH